MVFHVTYEPGGWCLWLAGGNDTVQHFARKEDAVRTGVRHAEAAPPSQLHVYGTDGRVERTRVFEPKSVRPTPSGSSEYFIGPGGVDSDQI